MRKLLAMGGELVAMIASPAFAKIHEIQMWDKNPDNTKQHMVFLPAFLQIETGDSTSNLEVMKTVKHRKSQNGFRCGFRKY